jgi:uncharacterized protein YceK
VKTMRTSVVLAITAALLSGCGTTCNLAEGALHADRGAENYGGLQKDLELARNLSLRPSQETSAWGVAIFAGLLVSEFSLTFVGDTLTLPLTCYIQQRRYAADTATEPPAKTKDHSDDASDGVSPVVPTDPLEQQPRPGRRE